MTPEPIICEGCKAPLDFCICAYIQKFTTGNQGSGYLVTTKKGLQGRTFHSKGLINGKVPVYIGENKTPMLCAPDSLKLNGFVD